MEPIAAYALNSISDIWRFYIFFLYLVMVSSYPNIYNYFSPYYADGERDKENLK
jgi:hypothetical protein